MAKNKQKIKLEGREVLRKKVLILGETGSGKTKLAAKLLKELTALVNPKQITVIDLAPQRTGDVGGKIIDSVKLNREIKHLSPKKVYTPRLTANSPDKVLHYAKLNRENMEPLLNEYIQNPTEALIINDVTLYLHSGKLETVLECANLAKTFLATAYYGSKLADDLGTGISSRERQLIDKLSTFMNLIVKID